jgi:hypothetical protein
MPRYCCLREESPGFCVCRPGTCRRCLRCPIRCWGAGKAITPVGTTPQDKPADTFAEGDTAFDLNKLL